MEKRRENSASKAAGDRILAIDYGRRRIGMAISDPLGATAQPLAVLERSNRRDDLRRLREIVRKHEVGRIVFGHPLHLDGTAGEMAEEVARFAARVKKELGLEVEFIDERLTSWEAEQIATRTSRRQRNSSRRADRSDAIAAALILRDYLDRRRGKRAGN